MTEHESAQLMKGKKGLVLGVANDRSIAWGVARALRQAGAELAFTYQGEALGKRVIPLAKTLDASLLFDCDVTEEDQITRMMAEIEKTWGQLDFLVHAVAFSDKDELKGKYIATSKANFLRTMDISCYSFTEIMRLARPMMKPGSAALTLTYYGAERVMPHYNVMGVAKAALEASVRYLASDLGAEGVRVNALSAGPIKTLAASGIGDFRAILRWNALNSPLQRNVTIDDVGAAGLYLLSDLASGVTGENHHVDAGYHTVGMINLDHVDEVRSLIDTVTGRA